MGGTEEQREKPPSDAAASTPEARAAEAKRRAAKKERIEAIEAILYGVVLAVLGFVVLFILVSRSR